MSTEINAWEEERHTGTGDVEELTFGWEMRGRLREGKGTCPGLGAFPRSSVSPDVQCAGGHVAPLSSPPLTLGACLSGQAQRSWGDAVASINSMWQQSTTALGPLLPQAGFHNLSSIPDLLPLGQEVMCSRPLPTLGHTGSRTAVAGAFRATRLMLVLGFIKIIVFTLLKKPELL